MKTTMFRICAIVAVGLAASVPALHAQQNNLEGVWDVSVTVTNCDTGATIRTVRSIQAMHHDGSLTETANSASRGISEGTWKNLGAQTYNTHYYFFRYTSTGTFASFAVGNNTVTLGDSGHFTATGTVLDFDAAGNLLSKGCVVHTAYRLTDSEQ